MLDGIAHFVPSPLDRGEVAPRVATESGVSCKMAGAASAGRAVESSIPHEGQSFHEESQLINPLDPLYSLF